MEDARDLPPQCEQCALRGRYCQDSSEGTESRKGDCEIGGWRIEQLKKEAVRRLDKKDEGNSTFKRGCWLLKVGQNVGVSE